MKKVLLLGAFVLGISAVSLAQGGPGGGGGGRMGGTPEQQIERLKTSITGITDAQTAKLMVVYQAQSKSRDSLTTALNGDFGAMREKMAPLRTAQTAKIKAVLTAEQNKAYDALPPQGRGGFGGGGAPGAGGPPRN